MSRTIPPTVAALTLTLAFTASAATCPEGNFISSSGACKPCPAGHYQWLKNQRSCTPCALNTYTPFTGVVDRLLCLACPLNSYSKKGSTSCTMCPAGQVRSSPVATTCRPCRNEEFKTTYDKPVQQHRSGRFCPNGFIPPPAYVSYFPDHVCVSGSTGCPKGTKYVRWVRRALCKRQGKIACPLTHVFDGKDRCLRCWAGSRVVYNAQDKRLQCHQCPPYTASRGGISRRCWKCPKWFVSLGDRCFDPRPKNKPFKVHPKH